MGKKNLLCLLILLSGNVIALAQITYQGKVFDNVHHSPIAGALVSIGSKTQQISDEDGNFRIEANESADSLTISHINYRSTVLALNPKITTLNISLAPKITTLNEIVIQSFNKQKKWFNEAAAIGVLAPKEFQRNNDVSVSNFLNLVPGVYMHSGALNTNRITIRGIGSRSLFSTNKIKAYLNGIPLTSGDGETTVEDIDLRLIDRIEVIKGPNASSFGAGLGGALLYTTAKPNYRTTGVEADVTAGSFGLKRATIKAAHSDDQKNISFVLNSTQSDGFRDNNNYDRQAAALMANFYTNNNNSLHFFGNIVRLKAFIPSSLDLDTFQNNPSAAAFTWRQTMGFEDYDKFLFGLAYHHQFNQNWQLKTSIFSTGSDAYELRPFNVLKENTNGLGVRTLLNSSQDINHWPITFVIGLEYFQDWYNWETFENDNRTIGAILSNQQEKRNYLNIFSTIEIDLSKYTTLTLGANINRTRYQLSDFYLLDNNDQSGNYSFKTTISPRLALLQKVNKSLSAYINISHGFSPPTLAETLTPDGQINLDIQPESGYNFEVGIKGSIAKQKVNFDLSLYQMFIRNLLVARRVNEDQFIGINAGRTIHRGIELSANYRLFTHPLFEVDAFSNLTFTDFKFDEFIDGDNDFSGNQLTGNPAKVINVGFDISLVKHIYSHIQYQYVDEIPVNDSNEIFSDAYGLINVKLGYKNRLGKRLSIDVNAGVNNLNDEQYASMILINARGFGGNAPRYYYPGLPRNYYSQLKIGYNFN